MRDYREEIDEIRSIESSSDLELIPQTLIVAIGVSTAWWFLGLWQLLVWFVLEYGLVYFERYLHARPSQKYSRKLYFRYLGLTVLLSSGSAFLPIFLWAQGAEIFYFAAMVYTVGALMNTFLVRAKAWPVLLCYLLPKAMVFFVIAGMFWMDSGTGAESVAALVFATTIGAYLMVCVAEVIRRHRHHLRTTRELFHAQKMETVGNLAGGIAHDFNNLLGVVSGSLELLQTADSEEERRQLISQAQVATERSAALTRRMLAFGRQTHLAPEPVHPQALLSELQEMLKRLLPEYIETEVKCGPGLSTIWIDKSALLSTLINLALNARDAMQQSGKLDVTAELDMVFAGGRAVSSGQLEPGHYVEFSVSDSGEGISPDVFGHVLEPFFTTKGVGEGSGLGLSMVAGFARQSNGGVEITSAPGQGTRVSLFIPIVEPIQTDASVAPQTVETTDNSAQPHRSILLVEDEALLRAVIEKQLTTEGYAVNAFENADDALQAVDSGFTPEIVLTDIVMPGSMQGTELVKTLRPRFPKAKFIVMTGYAFSNNLDVGAEKSDYSMISKPFKLKELADHLDRVLN